MPGIRAELVFDSPDSCPVARASRAADGPLTDVSWTSAGETTVTEQFSAGDGELATDARADQQRSIEKVFDYGSRTVYEFDRDRSTDCICEFVEGTVGPVTETYAMDGDLHVTLHVGDMDDLREHLREFDDRFGRVRIEYLVRGRDEADADSEIVPVDLRRLTDRQREVLTMAYEMGYFDYPRDANAGEVAETLDIEASTFTEHLNAAQSKILDELRLEG